MRCVSNEQGGHELLGLRTGCTIARLKCTPVPTTKIVIDLVHALAACEGIPKGLNITTKTGTILYDSSCVAGVEYADAGDALLDDDDEDDDEEEQDDDDLNDDDNSNEEPDPDEAITVSS